MVDIKEEAVTAATLREYGTVSIAFLVETRYRVELIRNGLGGWTLTEEPVECPYGKDYDQIDGEEPAGWAARFDTSRWGMLSAFDGEKRVGGAVLALATPDVFMLEGRSDLAVLWDIRVQPDYRRRGVGALLFPRVVGWARERECTHLKVETQNINVPACKFYARMGCELLAIHPDAYAALPDEVQLLWYRPLSETRA